MHLVTVVASGMAFDVTQGHWYWCHGVIR